MIAILHLYCYGNRLYGSMGFLSKKWEWTGVDTVIATRAPAVRKSVFGRFPKETSFSPRSIGRSRNLYKKMVH